MGLPIFHVRHSSQNPESKLYKTNAGFEIMDAVKPINNEPIITKDVNSAFIAKKLKAKFYFAHPYSSWERGLSEYSNKLIRQYVPKKSIFGLFSTEYLNQVNIKLNNRPRKLLDFNSPLNVFMGNL